jgi:hypothetical protein
MAGGEVEGGGGNFEVAEYSVSLEMVMERRNLPNEDGEFNYTEKNAIY